MKNLSKLLQVPPFLCFACTGDNMNGDEVYPGVNEPALSPYTDPIWHPSGDIIGFNHTPVKEVQSHTGPNNRVNYFYVFDDDSSGFWLIKPDGTNKRRILPFTLLHPSWSSDGKWIAFVHGAQIFKMPFDGEQFDTLRATQLTFGGRNFFPSWSPDGSKIAYDNTVCGTAAGDTPPPNSCGMLVMNADGTNTKFIAPNSRMPYWSDANNLLYSFHTRHNLETGVSEVFFDPIGNGILFGGPPRFSCDNSKIGFLASPVAGGYTKLYSITPHGQNLALISSDTIQAFSWGPNNQIVYGKFDNFRIDRTKGALWIMDESGHNRKPLTFNSIFDN